MGAMKLLERLLYDLTPFAMECSKVDVNLYNKWRAKKGSVSGGF
jgi:hypothetical protein